ncbi:MAG: hypothetical protein QG610_489 [Euryarchaeota archaeon]|nr:hypothetical protein [Euryarchaeota archaeon]
MVHVKESVSYAFDGDYIYVYRMINTSAGESIRNIEGCCSNNSCKFRVETTPEGYKLIGELPEPTPKNLTFFISYDHYGAVKVHDNISEFQFQWGEEWERPLGSLKASITFPVENKSEIRYWTHPAVYTQEENLECSALSLKTKEIPASHWYEIRVVFPGIESPNPMFVQVDDTEKIEEILVAEKKYQQKESSLESLYRITSYMLVFVLLFPIIIYFRYGRELETGYEEETEYGKKTGYKDKINFEEKDKRELQRGWPSDSRPAVVNAIMRGRMGIPTMDGFTATFMDLANRGYISLRNLEPEEIGSSNTPESDPEDFIIELSHDRYSKTRGSLSKLEDFEEDVLNLLKNHAFEREISWREFRKELEGKKEFYQFIIAWSKKVQVHTEIDRYFQSTGNMYMNWFSRAVLAAAILYYIGISGYFPSDEFPRVSKINTLTALIGIWGFMLTKNSGIFIKIFGRWTPEGILYYECWDNFKKYITDLSALKKYPPESIKTWDSYLVYAASLGVAKQAFQNMSLIVPFEQLKESRFHPISYYYYNQSGHISGNAFSSSYQGGDEN